MTEQDTRVRDEFIAAIDEAMGKTASLRHTHSRELYDLSDGELAPEGECPLCDHFWDFCEALHRRAKPRDD